MRISSFQDVSAVQYSFFLFASHCNLFITYSDARFTDHTTLVHAVTPGGEYHSDYP